MDVLECIGEGGLDGVFRGIVRRYRRGCESLCV